MGATEAAGEDRVAAHEGLREGDELRLGGRGQQLRRIEGTAGARGGGRSFISVGGRWRSELPGKRSGVMVHCETPLTVSTFPSPGQIRLIDTGCVGGPCHYPNWRMCPIFVSIVCHDSTREAPGGLGASLVGGCVRKPAGVGVARRRTSHHSPLLRFVLASHEKGAFGAMRWAPSTPGSGRERRRVCPAVGGWRCPPPPPPSSCDSDPDQASFAAPGVKGEGVSGRHPHRGVGVPLGGGRDLGGPIHRTPPLLPPLGIYIPFSTNL